MAATQVDSPRTMEPAVAPGTREVVVNVTGLDKTYGTTTAADDVSFAVYKGEIFGIVALETLPEDAAGRRLYEKFGFVVHGRLPRAFYRAGAYHDFLLMHRAIPAAVEPPVPS